MEHTAPSITSDLSWNTRISRTSVSSLSCARFSAEESLSSHGLQDVIRTLQTLSLPHYRLGELVREERLGQGETYVVERCVDKKGDALAVKHLKVSTEADDAALRQRLRSVILEIKIMRHGPLRAHPNILDVRGYGWNTPRGLIVPYILVDYAPLGTMREYISRVKPPLSHIEILAGDVASGLSILHTCGIIHGDMKLDNVLVFPDWDRPAKAIAKIADFGHAVILSDKSCEGNRSSVRYKGTSMYNAPEVHTQDDYPIDQQDLFKCDMWAFGLLIWEACIEGDEYLCYLTKHDLIMNEANSRSAINWQYLLNYAKSAVQGPSIGPAMFLRATLHMTLQDMAMKRVTDARTIPIGTQWNSKPLLDLQSDMALHLESPTPTYEMFRLDSGREITWQHQQQIFHELTQTHSKRLIKEMAPVLWQIALCHHFGFGTPPNQEEAFRYGQMAASQGHEIAKVFGCLLDFKSDSPQELQKPYVSQILTLLSSEPDHSADMPDLVKACFQGDYIGLCHILARGASVFSSTTDGCTLYHWLFVFQERQLLQDIFERLSSKLDNNSKYLTFDNNISLEDVHKGSMEEATHLCEAVNYPCTTIRYVHSQWPTQLLGTPLAIAISLNSLGTVEVLLNLGADPFVPVYDSTQFSDADPRSHWTAFHIAAKYHCNDILLHLAGSTNQEKQRCLAPLACALSFSSNLERLAMHRSHHRKQLRLTIATIQKIQTLDVATDTGMTALMQAIDFQDIAVVSELLEADPHLAHSPFHQPVNDNVFNLPIHFATQIGARRDDDKALLIPQLLVNYADFFKSEAPVPRDSMGRTPLHFAVTGSSNKVSDWILNQRKGLLYVEDNFGKVPLHYCASVSNCELLLSQGATINHTDKYGITALHLACYNGSTELVRCLLRGSPDLSLHNNQYGTPLHCGVLNGSVDTVICLLEAGAMVNGVDPNGNTATHVAARLERHSILRIFMQYGADVHVPNRNKRTAKIIAANAGNISILRILERGWETKVDQEILRLDRNLYHLPQAMGSDGKHIPDFAWEASGVPTDNGSSNKVKYNTDKTADEIKRADQSETRFDQKQALNTLEEFWSHWLPSLLPYDDSMSRIKRLASMTHTGKLWQPGYASRLIEFWARTVLVIAEILQNHTSTEVITAVGQLANSGEMDKSIGCMDISGSRKAAVWIATEFLAVSIEATKPREVYPGRKRIDFKDMIYCELRMNYKRSCDENKLLSFFPELNFFHEANTEEESQHTRSDSTSFKPEAMHDSDYLGAFLMAGGWNDYEGVEPKSSPGSRASE